MNRIFIIIVLIAVSFGAVAEKIKVKVGTGIRPPFLLTDGKGLGPEIINTFNLIQDDFHFELISVPISRRVMSLKEGWIDLIMWDNLKWGWDEGLELNSSNALITAKDVYVSFNSSDKTQSYFDESEGKIICGVNGYHYKLFNYETDYKELKKQHKVILVRTEEESIKMALKRRCDISIVSTSEIDWFLTLNPEKRNDLLISEKYDTHYSRHFLVPVYSPISASELNLIFNKANKLGLLKSIYERYGQKLN